MTRSPFPMQPCRKIQYVTNCHLVDTFMLTVPAYQNRSEPISRRIQAQPRHHCSTRSHRRWYHLRCPHSWRENQYSLSPYSDCQLRAYLCAARETGGICLYRSACLYGGVGEDVRRCIVRVDTFRDVLILRHLALDERSNTKREGGGMA